MAAKSTKDLQACISKGVATATVLVPTEISSAKPAVVTVVNSANDGDMVYCALTGFPELDGKWWVIASASGTEFTLLGSDTVGSSGVLDASPAVDLYDGITDMECVCFSSLTLNVDEPSTISVATFCDPSATIASAVSTAGTLSFAGFVDILGTDYQELLGAEADGEERALRIELPSNGYLVAPITIASITWDLPIDGAIGYTGTMVLSTKMVHQF